MLSDIIKFIVVISLGVVLLIFLTILSLRWLNPPFTAFTLQTDWEQLDRDRYNLNTDWVQYDEIPEHMIWAVIASEDQLFFEHNGFDFDSMQEAWEEHQKGARTRGASTISQQVAKNIFLSPAQSFIRKGVEAGLTVCIELLWPKERIIEIYINIAEFGPGVFGIGRASRVYFNRSATELTPEMAARLAAVLPNPKRMRLNPPSPYTRERSQWIIQQMNQLTGKTYSRLNIESSKSDRVNSTDSSIQSIQTDSLPQIQSNTLTPESDSINTIQID